MNATFVSFDNIFNGLTNEIFGTQFSVTFVLMLIYILILENSSNIQRAAGLFGFDDFYNDENVLSPLFTWCWFFIFPFILKMRDYSMNQFWRFAINVLVNLSRSAARWSMLVLIS